MIQPAFSPFMAMRKSCPSLPILLATGIYCTVFKDYSLGWLRVPLYFFLLLAKDEARGTFLKNYA